MTTLAQRVTERATAMRPGPSAAHLAAFLLGRIGWLAFHTAVLLWTVLAGVLKAAGWAAFWCTAAVRIGWEDAAAAAQARREEAADGAATVR